MIAFAFDNTEALLYIQQLSHLPFMQSLPDTLAMSSVRETVCMPTLYYHGVGCSSGRCKRARIRSTDTNA